MNSWMPVTATRIRGHRPSLSKPGSADVPTVRFLVALWSHEPVKDTQRVSKTVNVFSQVRGCFWTNELLAKLP